MTITRKRSEVLMLYKVFVSPKVYNLQGSKWAYFVDKNEMQIESILKEQARFVQKETEKRGDVPKEFIEAEKALIAQFADKDEKGNVIYDENNSFRIHNDTKDEYDAARATLYEQFGEVGEKIKRYTEVINQYYDEEIKIDLHVITEENLPEQIDAMTRRMMREFIVDKI